MLSRKEIAFKIKPITEEDIHKDFDSLVQKVADIQNGVSGAVGDRCRIGNNVVDFFTFKERLNTRSKYNVNFYEFIERIDEFKEKKFIDNMLTYYTNVKNKNKTKNEYVVLKEVFNICIGAINIFRPLVAMEVYAQFKPTSVLDICAGWGGRCIGAAAMDVPRYIGLDINKNLQGPYKLMKEFLNTKSTTEINIHIVDAVNFSYELLPDYDMVFTSPPYYFLEKYSHNLEYENKQYMNNHFYKPLFSRSYAYLQKGGYYILNVNNEIYNCACIPVLGEADIVLPFKKSKRQNEYSEQIYVWKKNK